jgi:peptidoglycan hydrolase CwlO-like protein
MNKKFLSAILFGALMITSTGTFVSCKDYDDDINDLQEQIDDLKSSLTADVATLKADLAAAKSDLEGKLATAKSDLESKIANKADKTAVTALENQIATINEKLKKALYKAF